MQFPVPSFSDTVRFRYGPKKVATLLTLLLGENQSSKKLISKRTFRTQPMREMNSFQRTWLNTRPYPKEASVSQRPGGPCQLWDLLPRSEAPRQLHPDERGS